MTPKHIFSVSRISSLKINRHIENTGINRVIITEFEKVAEVISMEIIL